MQTLILKPKGGWRSKSGSPVTAYLSNLTSELGRRTQLQALRRAVAIIAGKPREVFTFPWHRLTYQATSELREELLFQHLAPATVNRILSAVRGVLRAAFASGLMTRDAAERAGMVARVRGEGPQRGRALAAAEIVALYQACDPATAAGARDGALLVLLHAGGLRREEAASLDVEDVDLAAGWLRVRGKGRRDRRVPLAPEAAAWLRLWLEHRPPTGPLLTALGRRGEATDERVGAHAVYRALGRLARRAAIEPATPHDCRRTRATELLSASVDLDQVATLLGHASTDTTRRYDRRGADALAAALRRVPMPVPGRRQT